MNKDFYNLEFVKALDFIADSSFESCTFKDIDFTALSLKSIKFITCTFENCNLANCSLQGSIFQDITFRSCKLLGLHFDDANPFGFSCQFLNCQMNHASFYQMQLQNCSFICCNLLGSDFSEVKAQGVSFEGSNLQDVVFERTDLRKANLLATQGLFLDPDENHIEKAKINRLQLHGLLSKYNIEIHE